MRKITKRYSNGEVTIIWKPHLCWHSGKCFTGLPNVFDPMVIPWVNPDAASTESIIVGRTMPFKSTDIRDER